MKPSKDYIIEIERRVSLPYMVIASKQRDTYVAINRDYKPCNTPHRVTDDVRRPYEYLCPKKQEWVRPSGDMIEWPNPFNKDEPRVEFFLFHDGCPPWGSAADLGRYNRIQAKIHTLADRLTLDDILPEYFAPYAFTVDTDHEMVVRHWCSDNVSGKWAVEVSDRVSRYAACYLWDINEAALFKLRFSDDFLREGGYALPPKNFHKHATQSP